MKGNARRYDELRSYCEGVPLIDCHDHSGECGPKYADPIAVITNGYFNSDLLSASSEADMAVITDAKRALEERWPALERAWKRTCHTGYAQVARRVLAQFYGESDLTLDGLRRMQGKLLDLTDRGGLRRASWARRRSPRGWRTSGRTLRKVLDGTLKLTPRGRLVISLPRLPRGRTTIAGVQAERRAAEPQRHLAWTSTWTPAARSSRRMKAFGAVAFKDQSAYSRALDYGNPTRAEAEEVFNWFMEDPRRSASLSRRGEAAGRLPVPRVHAHGARPGPAGADPHRAHGRHPQRHRQDQRHRADHG